MHIAVDVTCNGKLSHILAFLKFGDTCGEKLMQKIMSNLWKGRVGPRGALLLQSQENSLQVVIIIYVIIFALVYRHCISVKPAFL